MPSQFDLFHGLSFVVGLVVGVVIGWWKWGKAFRGAVVTINSIQCQTPDARHTTLKVVAQFDSGDTAIDLWSRVYKSKPTSTIFDPAQCTQFTLNPPAPVSAGLYKVDIVRTESAGWAVVWAHGSYDAGGVTVEYYAPSPRGLISCS